MFFETLIEKNQSSSTLLLYFKSCKCRKNKVIRFCKIETKFSTKVYTKWAQGVYKYSMQSMYIIL